MRKYIKINDLTDAIAINIAKREIPSLKGYFIQEEEYPFRLYWSLTDRQGDKVGKKKYDGFKYEKPASKTKRVSWDKIVGQVAVEKDLRNRITKEIIITTRSENAFIYIIQKHFLLQQGSLFYAKTDNGFFIKISSDPSIWIIDTCPGDISVWNGFGIEGVFIKRGLTPKTKVKSNRFQNRNATILVEEASSKSYNISWQDCDKIIQITPHEKTMTPTSIYERKIPVVPRLVEDDRRDTKLWRIKDLKKFERILHQENHDNLIGFRAWYFENYILVMAYDMIKDNPFKSVLNDAFEPFSVYKAKFFTPAGTTLMPRVNEEKLEKVFDTKGQYCLVEKDGVSVKTTTFEMAETKDLDFFIEYQAQKAISSLGSQWRDQWDLRFIKITEPIVIMKDGEKSDFINTTKRGGKKTKESTSETVIEHNSSGTRKELAVIDHRLADDTTNSQLWQERASLSKRLGNFMEEHVAMLNVALCNQDNESLIKHLNVLIEENKFGFDPDDNSDSLLASIRQNDTWCAEVSYAMHLWYFKKFEDRDVLNSAVNAMRAGYCIPDSKSFNRDFFVFCDFDLKEGSNFKKEGALDKSSLGKIKENANKLINAIPDEEQGYLEGFKGFSKAMFNELAKNNIDNALFEHEEYSASAKIREAIGIIDGSTDPQNIDDTESWMLKLQVNNLRETKVQDIFTGDYCRPVFSFSSKDVIEKEAEKIFEENDEESLQKNLGKQENQIREAKTQRYILNIIKKYGPVDDLRPFIRDFNINDSHFNSLIMNTDIFRIKLIFGEEFDQDSFFDKMLDVFPKPDGMFCVIDFVDGMEFLVLCLMISSNPKRMEYMAKIMELSYKWLQQSDDNLYDILSLIAWMMLCVIHGDLPADMAEYRFYARKKAIWINHANQVKQRGDL